MYYRVSNGGTGTFTWKTYINVDSGARFNSYISISELKKFHKVVLKNKVMGFSNSTDEGGWVTSFIAANTDITTIIATTSYTYLWNRQYSEGGCNGMIELEIS